MSFLGDMFSGLWSGSSGGFKAANRGIDDLAHGDFENTGNELENSYRSMAEVPGSPIAIDRAVYRGENGDLDWNPYSQNNSVWDSGAGGSQMTEDPNNRRTGRMIGSLMAGYGISSGLTAGAGLSAGAAGATSGAVMGGAQAAGTGGNRDDIFKGAMAGGAAGGIGGYVQNLDLAGEAGATNPYVRGFSNGALGGATTTALTPGSDSKDIGIGALYGGARGLGAQGGNKVDYEENGYSRAPWAQSQDTSMFADNTGGQSLPVNYNPSSQGGGYFGRGDTTQRSQESDNPFSPYVDKVLGFYKNADGSWNGKNIDSTVNGLMGLYGGYKRRQAASSLIRGMDSRRNDYSTALQAELMRKDAAAGRRSAYDTRGVELNARLAALDAQQAPALMNAKNSELAGLFNMIQSGYGMGRGLSGYIGNQAPQYNTLSSGFGPIPQQVPDMNYTEPYDLNSRTAGFLEEMPQVSNVPNLRIRRGY